MKHKHFGVMMEWAADTSKEVQYQTEDGQWKDCQQVANWATWMEYRIKPTPKPDVVAKGIVEFSGDHAPTAAYRTTFRVSEHYEKDNIILTFDGETGKLKSAEVL